MDLPTPWTDRGSPAPRSGNSSPGHERTASRRPEKVCVEPPPGPQPVSPLWEWAPWRQDLGGPRLTVRPRQAHTRDGGVRQEVCGNQEPRGRPAAGRTPWHTGHVDMGAVRARGAVPVTGGVAVQPLLSPPVLSSAQHPRRGPTGCLLRVPALPGGRSHAITPNCPQCVCATPSSCPAEEPSCPLPAGEPVRAGAHLQT